jgi:hypothetical protein
MSSYIVGLFASFHLLSAAARRTAQTTLRDPQWPALLACLCVWSPSVTMGFVQFFLCVPILLCGLSGAIGWIGEHPRRYDPILATAAAAALPSLHVMAAGLYLALLSILFLFSVRPLKRRSARLAIPAVALALAVLLWSRLGGLGLGRGMRLDLGGALRGALSLDFVNSLFRLKWSDPPIIASQVLWTVLGPYRAVSQLVSALALAAAALWIRAHGAPRREPSRLPPVARAFALLCLLAPWGMYVPTEITFINLRMMSVGFALLLVAVDPSRFEAPRARIALLALCALFTAHFAVRAAQFNREVAPVRALLDRAEPNKVLSSLVYHGKSDYFAKQFQVTHFLPTYYLAGGRGIATQFWARYTDHLPIDYHKGARPASTPDWNPERFEVGHLKDSDYLFIESATAEDSPDLVAKSKQALTILQGKGQEIGCAGLWCLYRVR